MHQSRSPFSTLLIELKNKNHKTRSFKKALFLGSFMRTPSNKTVAHPPPYSQIAAGQNTVARRLNIKTHPFWLAAAFAVLLSACQKNETIPTTADRLKSVEQNQQVQPDFYVPRKGGSYLDGLKNMKDAPVKPEPPAAVPAKPATIAVAPVLAPSSSPTPAPASGRAAERAVERAVEPAPTPPPQVASAAPTARAAAPKVEQTAQVTPIFREQPEFPRDAARQNIDTGSVRAKLTINAGGEVTNVTIVQSRPTRIFDRAVISSLNRWKFNPGAEGRSYETEINFQR